MTWTPENNETIAGLLAAEHPERLKALRAAKHGWLHFTATQWVELNGPPSWHTWAIYRAKPAPKWEPPAELWALLRPEILAIAQDESGRWWAYEDVPEKARIVWVSEAGIYATEALNLPEIPWEESLFIRPGRE